MNQGPDAVAVSGLRLNWSSPIRSLVSHPVRTAAASLALAFCVAPFALADETVAPAAAGPIDELPVGQQVSDTVIQLAGWVIASGDNGGYPFTIIDKAAAQILVFAPDGRLRGAAPGLFGSAIGDHSAPGVADSALRDIPMEDRTTPAGRFVGGYGPALGGERALWIDHENAVSIHPVVTTAPEENRPERLASPTPDDNRITHGCINVSLQFYEYVISPSYANGGLFYVLPDVVALGEAIPGFASNSVVVPAT